MTSKYAKNLEIDDFLPDNRSAVADYTCNLCDGVYYKPVIDSNNGSIFCNSCVQQAIKENKLENKEFVSVKFLSDIIENKSVFCKNLSKNCCWTGRLATLNDHLSECSKQTVKCPNSGCEELTYRENLNDHKNQCEFRIVSCPRCSITIENRLLDNHLQFDENCLIDCPFKAVGCNSIISKNNLSIHKETNKSEHIIHLLMNQIESQKEGYNKLLDRICNLEIKIQNDLKEYKNELKEELLKELYSLSNKQKLSKSYIF